MKLSTCLTFAAALLAPAALPAQVPAKPAQSVAVPPPLTPENTWNLDLSTGGRVVIQLRPDQAPLAVDRIRTLTRQGFYNGLTFHRVIEGFMAQGGDPAGNGTGGSELPDVKAEFNPLPHVRGGVASARAESNDSANSQFYLMLSPNLRLDNHYTVFGRVVSGIQYVDALEKGEPPATPSTIRTATIGAEAAVPAPPRRVAPPPPVSVPASAAPPPASAPPASAPPAPAPAPR